MKTEEFKIEFKKLVKDMFTSTAAKNWKESDDIRNFYEKFKTEFNISFDEFFKDVTCNFRFYYYLHFCPPGRNIKEVLEKYLI